VVGLCAFVRRAVSRPRAGASPTTKTDNNTLPTDDALRSC